MNKSSPFKVQEYPARWSQPGHPGIASPPKRWNYWAPGEVLRGNRPVPLRAGPASG